MEQNPRKDNANPGAEGIYEPLIQCFRGRRSIRSFQETPVPDEMIMKILEAGRWAPSGGNSQPWEFIVVKQRDMLKKIAEIFEKDREQRTRDNVNFPGSSKAYLESIPVMIVVAADPRWKQAYPMK